MVDHCGWAWKKQSELIAPKSVIPARWLVNGDAVR
jgi:hypothetical protein